jgi:hypothetical protein
VSDEALQQDEIERLKEIAEVTRRQLTSFYPDLDFDEEGLKKLDQFLHELGDEFDDDTVSDLLLGIGAMVGETLIRIFDGKWSPVEEFGGWGVHLGQEIGVMNPFAKASRVVNEPSESLFELARTARKVREAGGWERLANKKPN